MMLVLNYGVGLRVPGSCPDCEWWGLFEERHLNLMAVARKCRNPEGSSEVAFFDPIFLAPLPEFMEDRCVHEWNNNLI